MPSAVSPVRSLSPGLLLGLGLVMCLPSLPGCKRGNGSEAPPGAADVAPEAPKVRAVAVELRRWPRAVKIQGSLLSDELSIVGTKVAGRVKEIKVDLGSVVRAGQVLATLDDEQLELKAQEAAAQLAQARAKLGLKPNEPDANLDREKTPIVMQEKATRSEARSNLKRAESLREKRAISEEELQEKQASLDVAEAKYNSALNQVEESLAQIGVRKAELELARQIQADSVTRAPFDGVIQQRHVTPGTYVQMGYPVVTLVRTHPLRFRAGVPEREALLLRLRQKVDIAVEGLPDRLQAEIARISPSLEMSNRALLIECDVPNPDGHLRVGLFAEGTILIDASAETLALPLAAVTEFAGVEKVWLIERGQGSEATLREQIIRTGRRAADRVEVLGGVKAGDLVAAEPEKCRVGTVAVEPAAAAPPSSPPSSK